MVLTESDLVTLAHGYAAPQFTLKDTNGNDVSFPKTPLVLIVFMCNHCPYVLAKLDELNRIATDFAAVLTVIGINSNNNSQYPEDSYEKMQEMVNSGKITFTYLFDADQSVAKKYGATCTPDPFLFAGDTLIFHSRIANPPGIGPIQVPELYNAIAEYAKTGYIMQSTRPSMGCNIKWI